MNRRNFISLLAGSAGASLIPWRLPKPLIVLPARSQLITAVGSTGLYTYQWSWESGAGVTFPNDGLSTTLPTGGTLAPLDGLQWLWLAITDGHGKTVRHSYPVRTEILAA